MRPDEIVVVVAVQPPPDTPATPRGHVLGRTEHSQVSLAERLGDRLSPGGLRIGYLVPIEWGEGGNG